MERGVSAAAVRAMETRDVGAVLQIQEGSREAAQWTRAAYEGFARAGALAWVAESEGRVAGFLVARAAGGEMEILNLAVDAGARRRGVGSALLQAALTWAKRSFVKRMFLEVRASNEGARKFYEGHGFEFAGVRERYYREPVEDALLLGAALRRD